MSKRKPKPKHKSPSAAQLKTDGLWQLEARKRLRAARQAQINRIAQQAITQALRETILWSAFERGNA